MHAVRNGSPTRGPWVDFVPEALREDVESAFETEGLMERSAESRIMEALGKHHANMREDLKGAEGRTQNDIKGLRDDVGRLNQSLSGTNGDPGVFTRLKLLEDHTGRSATFWRHAKAALVTALVTASVTFVLSRVLVPNWSPDAERIKTLEQKLKEAEQKIEAQETVQEPDPGTVRPVKVPKQINKPRRPAPPEPQINRLRDEVTATNPLPTLGSMRFPYEASPFR